MSEISSLQSAQRVASLLQDGCTTAQPRAQKSCFASHKANTQKTPRLGFTDSMERTAVNHGPLQCAAFPALEYKPSYLCSARAETSTGFRGRTATSAEELISGALALLRRSKAEQKTCLAEKGNLDACCYEDTPCHTLEGDSGEGVGVRLRIPFLVLLLTFSATP